ncbi:uncharacterized protein LOC135392562 [Ornithodoros turicata]|uniref:uncharacterized protein LOC135392562 n=1 Tax=Ornithodoros turicata TaxID=34597 RepID=UPI00313880B8
MERLKHKRAARRAQVTKLIHEVTELRSDHTVTKTTLNGLLARLVASDGDLRKANEEIEPLVKDDDLAAEYEVIIGYEEQAANAIAEVQTRLAELQLGERTSPDATRQPQTAGPPENHHVQSSGVKLPKLQLQTFAGELTQWLPFWEQFRTAVHENVRLTKTEKFQYLSTLLKGQAASAIRGLQATESCYNDAIEILTQRFGNTGRIEREYLARLRNLPPVRFSTDVAGLRILYDHVQSNIRGLRALGIPTTTYASMMVDILLSSLPSDMVVEYQRMVRYRTALSDTNGTENDTSSRASESTTGTDAKASDELSKVLHFVRVELESREQCGAKSRSVTQPVHQQLRVKSSRNIPTGAVLHTRVGAAPNCVFCGSTDHDTPMCRVDMPTADKMKKLSREMRCFRCTKRGHRSKDCRSRITCKHCGRKHASSVCDPSKSTLPKEVVGDVSTTTNMMATNGAPHKQNSEVLLQTFRTWASSDAECALLRGVVDGGSQRTFVREDIAKKLKLKVIGESNMQINTFANDAPSNRIHKGKVVELRLRSQYHPKEYIIRATTIPFICKDLTSTPVSHDFVECIRRRGEFIADDLLLPNVTTEAGIGLLIGSDEMWRVLTGEVNRCNGNESLVAVGTVFGWTFQGPTTTTSHCTEQSTVAVCVLKAGVMMQEENDALKKFWELESIGIVDDASMKAEQNSVVLEEFERNVQLRGGRYEVALPWKARKDDLQDNYTVARNRLQGLVRRLNRDGNAGDYDRAIRTYIESGHAEKVTEDDDNSTTVYYMPHRAVTRNESSSTRVRVVFDASSHAGGATSLNDHLEKGPKLNTDLVSVLLRFRMHKVALTADIQKAFLQIGIQNCDRDALRFLWFSQVPTTDEHEQEIECWRMTRVPFGTTASPFLLGATLRHHLRAFEESDRELAATLMESFYVDDLLTGAATTDEALEIVRRSREILQQAGMNLTKWASNSSELQSAFEHEENGTDVGEKSFSEPTQAKVLGVAWDRSTDYFKFSGEHLLSVITRMSDTKRSVLQASSRIFDPLGFLAPYTIRVKIIFQELWKAGLDWDTTLPNNISTEWRSWCSELPSLREVSMERCLLPAIGTVYSHQLHIFSDASPQAYGACAFLRTKSDAGETKVRLIFAKSRVAPLKKLTLPRLELMGALIAARVAKLLTTALKMEASEVIFWTDSTIALSWIKGEANRWKPFVRNRVTEIQETTEGSQWSHCPGADNPADALTRGLTVKALIEDKKWFEGPTWLAETKESWPRSFAEDEESVNKVENEKVKVTALAAQVDPAVTIPPLLDLKKYSSYLRLLRVTAWIIRFSQNCRSRSRVIGPLTATELNQAEMFWVTRAQSDCYPEEMRALEHQQRIPAASKIAQLQPFLDAKGVMRLSGRLQCSDNPEEVKHPILLAKEHPLSELIARNEHRRALHSGVQTTLTLLREKWWISQARQLVKFITRRCKVCARFRATRATAPTAPLPADRTNPSHPFDTTGIDFAGPVYIKTCKGSSTKSYIALFTCSTTRAVHLELVTDLTTKSFLLAFRRFISRRGAPSTIYSDNALTFKKAARDIAELWNIIRSVDSQDFATTNRITWKFIVERAAWWGGMWERMVRTVKTCLRKILGRQCLTFEEMTTILHEVEAMVNSRPLTFLHSSPEEPSALTPAHLLLGKTLTALPEQPGAVSVPTSHRTSVNRKWIHRQKLADQFWKRWKKEYLLELRSAHQFGVCSPTNLTKGDVVLLQEDKSPRHLWRLARITQLYKGRDGKVRSCEVKLSSGNVTRRPVQLLFPLEVKETN